MICPVCNRTITSGDFCDYLQCPNPVPTAEGVGPIGEDTPYWRTLRAALVLPVEEQYAIAKDLAANCGYELTGDAYATPQPAPDAVREALAYALAELAEDRPSAGTVKTFEKWANRLLLRFDVQSRAPAVGDKFDMPSGFSGSGTIIAISECSAPMPSPDGALIDILCMEIERLRCVASDVRLLQAAGRFKEYEGEPWLKRAASLNLQRDITAELRAILSPSATGAAEPVADERVKQMASRLIGYVQARPDHTFERLLAHVSETIATFGYNEILNHRKALYATPPVRGDREAIKRAVCCPQGCQYEGDSEDGSKCYCDTSDYTGSGVEKRSNAVFAALSLPVQPGAGERGEDSIHRTPVPASTPVRSS